MPTTYQRHLEENVRRVMEAHNPPWTLMAAQIATGISRAIVNQMRHGLPPSATKLIQWAEAIGEDPRDWLSYGGYAYLANGTAPPASATESPDSAQAGTSVPPEPAESLTAPAQRVQAAVKRKTGGQLDEQYSEKELTALDDLFEVWWAMTHHEEPSEGQ